MISVTVAANGRSRRCVGAHLRAYGSGRLSLCDLDKDSPEQKKKLAKKGYWYRLIATFLESMTFALEYCFPFLFSRPQVPRVDYAKLPLRSRSTYSNSSPVNQLTDTVLKNIFRYLDGDSVVSCERVCRKWKRTVDTHIRILPKRQLDQLRILFDEGEIILYPSDEKRSPARQPMPCLKVLGRRLRHIQADSLLVRGLIPVEAMPVLKALCALHIKPKQIYFIWSRFSLESMNLLQTLLVRNVDTLTDFGLEDCSPTNLLTDELVEPVLKKLISLRVWNDGKGGNHGVTDKTIKGITEAISSGEQLETLDLSSVNLSPEAMASMILAWVSHAKADMSISVTHSRFDESTLLDILSLNGVYVCDGRIRANHYCLSVFWRNKC